MFLPVDLRTCIFRNVSKDNWRDRMAIMSIACKVTATPLNNADNEIRGVILMMDEHAAAGRPH